MIEFITDHYLIIMGVAVFLVFALIGFLIDSLRNKNKENNVVENHEVASDVYEISVAEENENPVFDEVEEPEEEFAEEVIMESEIAEKPEKEAKLTKGKKALKQEETFVPEIEEAEDNI